ETVAVRMSSHPVFQRVVTSFGGPLAAPSANRFGRLSPTSAGAVMKELGGRIPLIPCARWKSAWTAPGTGPQRASSFGRWPAGPAS
ncbi:MAG: telomere recombination, partial [Verrucomicrobiales bacterium]|nr:telomere recombination [Verrucomicrobiales bacterium]